MLRHTERERGEREMKMQRVVGEREKERYSVGDGKSRKTQGKHRGQQDSKRKKQKHTQINKQWKSGWPRLPCLID